MKDLFGFDIPESPPEDDYQTYINSARWKRIRAAKLEQAGYQCDTCGISKFSVTLEVHHLTYDNLGRERMDELQVLCPECHTTADEERKTTEEIRRKSEKLSGSLYRGFAEWLFTNVPRNRAVNSIFANQSKKKFLVMLKNKSGNSYKLDLTLLGYRDENPEWRP